MSHKPTKQEAFFGECVTAWHAAADRHWLGTPPTHLHPADRAALKRIVEAVGQRTSDLLMFAASAWRRGLRQKIADAMNADRESVPADCRLGLLSDHMDVVLRAYDEGHHHLARPVEVTPAARPRPSAQALSPLGQVAKAWHDHMQAYVTKANVPPSTAAKLAVTEADIPVFQQMIDRVGEQAACALIRGVAQYYTSALAWAAEQRGEVFHNPFVVARPADVLRELDTLVAWDRAREQAAADAADDTGKEPERHVVPLTPELQQRTAVRV